MKRAALLLCLLLSAGAVWAQKKDPVQWTLTSDIPAAPPGSTVPLKFHAAIQPGWHIYALTIPGPSPIPTTVKVDGGDSAAIYQPQPEHKVDPSIDLDTDMFEQALDLWLLAKLGATASGDVEITASARYQACDNRECMRPVTKSGMVTIKADPGAPPPPPFVAPKGYVDINDKSAVAVQAAAAKAGQKAGEESKAADDGLFAFALTAFGFGLAAIFTPCVFPMIPITVSFFLGQRGGILQAFVFAAGIIALFCGLALAMTLALGPFGVVQMSSNPWVNGFIALVFLAFAMSLLGAFEITLPSGLLTKMDHASRRGGYLGTLLMGLTFSLTSFACVGPFVGPLLASSATSGNLTQPVVGMASFATGLASPFFFLAAFPSYLKKLPRSGGWLARVKVVMGFVLLAVMLKYLSNIDQVLQTGFLTRERFLAAWVVLFAMAGLYLLGFLRLEGVEPGEHMGIGRLLTGSAFVIFALSLVPGMFCGALGELDAYVPAATSCSVSVAGGQGSGAPAWMKDDYQAALAAAQQDNKLVLVNFTGYACTNCHWMKANMFPRPEIAQALNEFVRVELYTDGPADIADKNQKLQERYDTVSQPFYVLMKPDQTVVATFSGSTRDPQEYLAFLNKRPI
jgi:thiol:disulfide interchange protein DsbD